MHVIRWEEAPSCCRAGAAKLLSLYIFTGMLSFMLIHVLHVSVDRIYLAGYMIPARVVSGVCLATY